MQIGTFFTTLLDKHSTVLSERATHLANGEILIISKHVERLRSLEEQKHYLKNLYSSILARLMEVDKSDVSTMCQLYLSGEITLEIAQDTDRQIKERDLSPTLPEDYIEDLKDILNLKVDAVPVNHLASQILNTYARYVYFNRLQEAVAVFLDACENLEVKERTGDIKSDQSNLSNAQKVILLESLMRWSGVETRKGMGAAQNRLIAAVTGIHVDEVKKMLARADNKTSRPQHRSDLEAIAKAFETLGANEQVTKIQTRIEGLDEE